MANETVKVVGTVKTLEANGASTATDVVSAADDASYGVAADGSNYPHAEFVLGFTISTTTSIQNKTINLYAKPLDIDGTNDAQAPETGANFKGVFIGAFTVNDIGTIQYASCVAYDVPWLADYYIDNQTGQTISAGWTLKVKPMTYKPAV